MTIQTPRARRDSIIIETCRDHGVSYLEIKTKKRRQDLHDARVDAAVRLRRAGYSLTSIGDAMGRSYRCVQDYLDSAEKVANRLRDIPADALAVLSDVAGRHGCTEHDVMIAWIVERAKQERTAA